jgi:carboxylate-amine ligase
VLEHRFTGPPYTIGIEEELMILDSERLDLAQEVEGILADVPPELADRVKPEFMQSFLEVATEPCQDVAGAARELKELRNGVAQVAEGRGLLLGAAGTHPWALWEDQLIVDRPRYHRVVEELGYIARQFLIFGTHVHIGMDDPDRAIYVADGVRRYLPLLLALSSNSPFLRGRDTGMMSARTPVYRALPRAGIPPHFGSWQTYSERVEVMMRSGAIEDYTFLWWDARPHPNLGTVEIRVFDQQTTLDKTIARAALTLCIAHLMGSLFEMGEPLRDYPTELVDDNKIRAAIHGMEGELLDFFKGESVPAEEMARDLLERLAEHAQELGCERELAGVEELLAGNTGARRQLRLLERVGDLKTLVREVVEASRA